MGCARYFTGHIRNLLIYRGRKGTKRRFRPIGFSSSLDGLGDGVALGVARGVGVAFVRCGLGLRRGFAVAEGVGSGVGFSLSISTSEAPESSEAKEAALDEEEGSGRGEEVAAGEGAFPVVDAELDSVGQPGTLEGASRKGWRGEGDCPLEGAGFREGRLARGLVGAAPDGRVVGEARVWGDEVVLGA